MFVKRRAVLIGLLFLQSALASVAVHATCDPNLARLSGKDDLAYQDRGDRCEGTYALQVGASPYIQLVSLTDRFPNVEPRTVNTLDLVWRAPANAPAVQLRGTSLKYQLYYRMDAARPASDRRFRWPTNLLKSVDLLRREIGVLSWTPVTMARHRQVVYLPLTVVGGPGPQGEGRGIEAVVVPSVELSEVYCSITRYDRNVDHPVNVMPRQPLRFGAYPADAPIAFTISARATSPWYLVELSGVVATGGSVGTRFWFYYER